jgi:hypothetical protein
VKKVLLHLPIVSLLLLGIAAPATAANTNRSINPYGIDSTSYGTNMNDRTNNMQRYNQYNNGFNGTTNGTTNGYTDNTRTYGNYNNDGLMNNRTNNNNTYRARAGTTNDNNTNWSWLGLLGLLGLAGMFRGNRNESRP